MIKASGDVTHVDTRRILAAIHHAVADRGYEDIVFDFRECTSVFTDTMLPVCAHAMKLRANGTLVDVFPPIDSALARLFRNANWLFLLNPKDEFRSHFRGYTQVPATTFLDENERAQAVNNVIDAILRSNSDFSRSDFKAIEWSINEISDNVLVHSRSDVGGIVQLSTFESKRLRVEFAVCDAGIGIPNSLRSTSPGLADTEALDRAIREEVTRDKSIGQGNGLFGSYQISRVSGSHFRIQSGYADLYSNPKRGLHVEQAKSPLDGTLVVTGIDCSQPGVLDNALRFGGKPHVPVDFIETKYENDDDDRVVFRMKDESQSFGSRAAAVPVRNKLVKLSLLCLGQKIYIDFSDVPVISSSFADELIGKLYVKTGPLLFIQKYDFKNVSDTVRSLIDKAILQRSSTGL